MRKLTIILDDSGKDAEAFVTVYDKSGKDMGGGNVMSGGPLMVSVNDGTYKVKVTDINMIKYINYMHGYSKGEETYERRKKECGRRKKRACINYRSIAAGSDYSSFYR